MLAFHRKALPAEILNHPLRPVYELLATVVIIPSGSPSLAGRLRFRNRDSTRNDSGCVRPFARRAPTQRCASYCSVMPWPTPPVSITTGPRRQREALQPSHQLAARVLASLRPDPTNPTMGLATAAFVNGDGRPLPTPPGRSPDAALVSDILQECAAPSTSGAQNRCFG